MNNYTIIGICWAEDNTYRYILGEEKNRYVIEYIGSFSYKLFIRSDYITVVWFNYDY